MSLTNRLAHHSTTPANKRKQWRTWNEHSRLKSGPPVMRALGIHKNIPVSDTKLTLGFRVGFISSHLRADKLFPLNPRANAGPPKMSLLFEAKSTPALIVKLRLILSNVQPAGTDAYSKPQLDWRQTKCYANADLVLHHKLFSNWLDI